MLNKIIDILQNQLGNKTHLVADENASPAAIIVEKDDLLTIMNVLYNSPELYFDMLSCITGIDNGDEAGTMEVVYNLYSIPFEKSLMIKVLLKRTGLPEISSIANIWKTANWQEREIFDLLGINFTDHPDMRRILMPTDWIGYPLRKDYENPEKYRGMNVEYDRDDEQKEDLTTDN